MTNQGQNEELTYASLRGSRNGDFAVLRMLSSKIGKRLRPSPYVIHYMGFEIRLASSSRVVVTS